MISKQKTEQDGGQKDKDHMITIEPIGNRAQVIENFIPRQFKK
jgi:hypothetical protein